LLALLAACALLVVLAWQNRQLREERRWFVKLLRLSQRRGRPRPAPA